MAVGGAGIVTLGVMNVMFALPPDPERMPWQLTLVAPLIYGTLANVCYTGGWAAELFLRRHVGDRSGTIGAALYRYGFAFSIGLTLFPAGISVLAWLARVVAMVA